MRLRVLAADIAGSDQAKAREAATAHLDALHPFKLTGNSPARQPHMRSRTQLQVVPARYFVDRSLGTSVLDVGFRDLLADLEAEAAGFHFEALVIRDLRIHAQLLRGTIASRREAHGRKEVDAIVEKSDGWAAFEVKLTRGQGFPQIDHMFYECQCNAVELPHDIRRCARSDAGFRPG